MQDAYLATSLLIIIVIIVIIFIIFFLIPLFLHHAPCLIGIAPC